MKKSIIGLLFTLIVLASVYSIDNPNYVLLNSELPLVENEVEESLFFSLGNNVLVFVYTDNGELLVKRSTDSGLTFENLEIDLERLSNVHNISKYEIFHDNWIVLFLADDLNSNNQLYCLIFNYDDNHFDLLKINTDSNLAVISYNISIDLNKSFYINYIQNENSNIFYYKDSVIPISKNSSFTSDSNEYITSKNISFFNNDNLNHCFLSVYKDFSGSYLINSAILIDGEITEQDEITCQYLPDSNNIFLYQDNNEKLDLFFVAGNYIYVYILSDSFWNLEEVFEINKTLHSVILGTDFVKPIISICAGVAQNNFYYDIIAQNGLQAKIEAQSIKAAPMQIFFNEDEYIYLFSEEDDEGMDIIIRSVNNDGTSKIKEGLIEYKGNILDYHTYYWGSVPSVILLTEFEDFRYLSIYFFNYDDMKFNEDFRIQLDTDDEIRSLEEAFNQNEGLIVIKTLNSRFVFSIEKNFFYQDEDLFKQAQLNYINQNNYYILFNNNKTYLYKVDVN